MNQLQAIGPERGRIAQKGLWSTEGEHNWRHSHWVAGRATPARVVGVAGPHEPNDWGINHRHRAGSRRATRGDTTDDSPWRGSAYSTRLCADRRNSDRGSGAESRWARYSGLIPREDSSGHKQRLGHISKQGSSLLRFLLVEAAQAAARIHPDWRRRYVHLAMRRHEAHCPGSDGAQTGDALVLDGAKGCEYTQSVKCGSHVGQLDTGHGVK